MNAEYGCIKTKTIITRGKSNKKENNRRYTINLLKSQHNLGLLFRNLHETSFVDVILWLLYVFSHWMLVFIQIKNIIFERFSLFLFSFFLGIYWYRYDCILSTFSWSCL